MPFDGILLASRLMACKEARRLSIPRLSSFACFQCFHPVSSVSTRVSTRVSKDIPACFHPA